MVSESNLSPFVLNIFIQVWNKGYDSPYSGFIGCSSVHWNIVPPKSSFVLEL